MWWVNFPQCVQCVSSFHLFVLQRECVSYLFQLYRRIHFHFSKIIPQRTLQRHWLVRYQCCTIITKSIRIRKAICQQRLHNMASKAFTLSFFNPQFSYEYLKSFVKKSKFCRLYFVLMIWLGDVNLNFENQLKKLCENLTDYYAKNYSWK